MDAPQLCFPRRWLRIQRCGLRAPGVVRCDRSASLRIYERFYKRSLSTVAFFYGSSIQFRARKDPVVGCVCRVFLDTVPRNGLLGQEVRMRGRNGDDRERTSGMKDQRK